MRDILLVLEEHGYLAGGAIVIILALSFCVYRLYVDNKKTQEELVSYMINEQRSNIQVLSEVENTMNIISIHMHEIKTRLWDMSNDKL